MKTPNMNLAFLLRFVFLIVAALLIPSMAGCVRPDPEVTVVVPLNTAMVPPTPQITPHNQAMPIPPTPIQQTPTQTVVPLPEMTSPTPDPPHNTFVNENDEPFLSHIVSAGETLGYIAQFYNSSIEELQSTNQLAQTDLLFVGQELLIPNQAELTSPNFKIIPDSELVYGPALKEFETRAFAAQYGGYLMSYQEVVEGQLISGPEIVSLVAHRYSVSPRLLLAILEYRTGWVTRQDVVDNGFPLGYSKKSGLYEQMGWAANELNWGFYARDDKDLYHFFMGDGARLAFSPVINDGTAGVQNLMASHDGVTYDSWLHDVGSDGFFTTFVQLFGNPFAYTVDPLVPDNLTQPSLQLPWANNEAWHYTGGPHGGWASGAAWAALDFAPPEEELGACYSEYWVTAMADGVVTRSDFGVVVIDLDGDNFAGTGWAVIHMHLDSRDRVQAGTLVQAGDRIGHPSCEGGYSTARHVHVSRTYNGRWMDADGPVPFEMNGWFSQGYGSEYDGELVRGGLAIEACDGCREGENLITAD